METYTYSGKYLSASLVRKTFRSNKITRVDKTLCGNGFTTAFLNLTPDPGKLNVLIEPNTGVILSKQKNNKIPNIEFRHQNGTHSGPIKQSTRLLVTTPDTFLSLLSELDQRGVDKICIDEAHAFAQQVSFRPKLRGFIAKISEHFKNSSIVTVTATPFVNSQVDIQLLPKDPISPLKIEVNNDFGAIIKEIKSCTGPVVIFSNSKKVLMNLRERDIKGKAFVPITLNVGTSLAQRIFREVIIKEDRNRFFGSVKAFEGLDLDYKNSSVYVFQDLNIDAEQFDLTNIVQAINRLRNEPKRISYSRIDMTNGFPNIYNILDKVKGLPTDDLGSRYKLKNRLSNLEIKIYFDCINWTYDKHRPIRNVDNEIVAGYYNKYLTITEGIHSTKFSDYLSKRGIQIIMKQPTQQKVKNLRTLDERFYIRQNADYVFTFNLHKQPFTYKPYKPSVANFFKQFRTYLEFRNFDGNYPITGKEAKLQSLVDDLSLHIEDHVKDYAKRKRKEGRDLRGTKAAQEIQLKISDYKSTALKYWLLLLADLVNTPIEIRGLYPKHHRDYGYFTEMPLDAIKRVAELIGLPCYEFDIKSCAIRILYNLEGIKLPNDIYGHNKCNKRSVNVVINKISKEKRGNTPIQTYRKNITDQLTRLNIELADTLVDRYFAEPTNEVHLVTTYHEKEIINQLKQQVFKGEGFRRHDSLILFREPTPIEIKQLEAFKYLGFGDYFTIPEKS